jgi:undecaprenyl-diphosphatase
LCIITFLLALAAFYFLAISVTGHEETALDSSAYEFLSHVASPFVTRLMVLITFFGSRYFMFPAYTALVIYFLFFCRKIKLGIVIAMLAIAGNGLLYLMQQLIHRQRPGEPLIKSVAGYSFPSGHAFAAYTFFGLLTFFLWRSKFVKAQKIILSLIFFLAATIIAATRIYLHVHYATDMLGGFCLSIMWLTFSMWILYLVDEKSSTQL